jgi:NAD(P)-dependent dehydrogenase (short-subunit alcohol dehydrogenase family)
MWKGEAAAQDIRLEHRGKPTAELGSIIVKRLDLSSLVSVRRCANEILREVGAIHVLINNAGKPIAKLDFLSRYTFHLYTVHRFPQTHSLGELSGQLLNRVHNSHNLNFISPLSPTYRPADPARLPDLLDFFVSFGLGAIHSSATSLYVMESMASPLITVLPCQPSTLALSILLDLRLLLRDEWNGKNSRSY